VENLLLIVDNLIWWIQREIRSCDKILSIWVSKIRNWEIIPKRNPLGNSRFWFFWRLKTDCKDTKSYIWGILIGNSYNQKAFVRKVVKWLCWGKYEHCLFQGKWKEISLNGWVYKAIDDAVIIVDYYALVVTVIAAGNNLVC